MKKQIITTLLTFLTLSISSEAYSKTYYMKFKDKDSSISFNVSSTLHNVDGQVNKFKGQITLKSSDDNEIDSADGFLEITADSLFTNQKQRDSKMKSDVLSILKFPLIKLKVNGAKLTANKIKQEGIVYLKLLGDLTIRDVTKSVEIPVKAKLSSDKSSAQVTGSYVVNFLEYNVPDPSLPIIGKVDPNINIKFNLSAK